jgi:hypothetical protein
MAIGATDLKNLTVTCLVTYPFTGLLLLITLIHWLVVWVWLVAVGGGEAQAVVMWLMLLVEVMMAGLERALLLLFNIS